MTACTYDNPATMSRECWQDGKLVASIKESAMYARGFDGDRRLFFGLNVSRDFHPDMLWGDSCALPPTIPLPEPPA